MRRSQAALGSSVFFVAAPGVVVGLVPWWLTGWHGGDPLQVWPLRLLGLAVLMTSVPALLRSFLRFVVEGLGTPAPVAPTQHLVVGGFYRHVRNPMYVAVVAAIVGQALLLARPSLLLYAAAVWLAVAAFARWYEEPALTRQFGAEYEQYRQAVPAWVPRLRPWDQN